MPTDPTSALGGSDFASDNSAGLCPEALAALTEAATGFTPAYGDDAITARAQAVVRDLLGDDTHVFFVVNGTAANTLAIASLTNRWERLLCEQWAHLNQDESTAPELLTGTRLTTIDLAGGKLTPAALRAAVGTMMSGVHHPAPGVVSITNTTEHGEVYTPDEVTAVTDTAHELGYRVHMDGARFANAVAAAGCAPRELTTEAGIDALSFGGTKNGLGLGEAVVLFGEAGARAAERFPWLRKGSGHLLSKMRYVTAPFAASIESGAWLRHAAHANAMAARLAAGFAAAGMVSRFPTQANAVFVELAEDVVAGLHARGWEFHGMGDPGWHQFRFMASFATTPQRVDDLLADLDAVLADCAT